MKTIAIKRTFTISYVMLGLLLLATGLIVQGLDELANVLSDKSVIPDRFGSTAFLLIGFGLFTLVSLRVLSYTFLKRLLDLMVGIVALILLIPLWLAITLVIYLVDGRPIFFKQERCGKDLKRFTLVKFRTMVRGKHKIESRVKSSSLTTFGKYLRLTGFDSLPELLSIIQGDMSWVGPRPMPYLVEDESGYKNIEDVPGCRLRSMVCPGLTGLAQIYLPKTASRRCKYRLDNLYVKRANLWLDFKLFALSVWFAARGKWDRLKREI
jgi:lipopolysaccharide/colanic/teichoic acid biosynthesis glycosyltransferase